MGEGELVCSWVDTLEALAVGPAAGALGIRVVTVGTVVGAYRGTVIRTYPKQYA